MTNETTVQPEQEVIKEQVTDQSPEQTEIDELRAQVAEFEALKPANSRARGDSKSRDIHAESRTIGH